MRPLTDRLPKPLLPVAGKPMIVWHLEKLARAGIHDVVINHAWLGHLIESQLGDGSQFGLNIRYSAEPTALETAGGIAKALPMLGPEPFLVINGDVWSDWDIAEVQHISDELITQSRLGWLLLVPNPVHHPEGDFALSSSGIVSASGINRYTFSGIGIYDPALFRSTVCGQPAKLAPLLREAMIKQAISGSLHTGTWVDVGTPQRLAELDLMVRAQ